jgi:hypothetical protein
VSTSEIKVQRNGRARHGANRRRPPPAPEVPTDAQAGGHMLRHLKGLGHTVPRETPATVRRYRELEAVVLDLADRAGTTPAKYDLDVFRTAQEGRRERGTGVSRRLSPAPGRRREGPQLKETR